MNRETAKTVKPFNVHDVSLAKKKKDFLERIHTEFAVALTSTLASYVSLSAKVTFQGVRQFNYETVQKEEKKGSLYSFFEIEPVSAHALLRLDAPLVLVSIDRILGGTGESPEARELSVIETKMAEALMNRILNQLNAAWELFGEFSFKLKSNAQTCTAFRFLAPEDPVLVITLNVLLNKTSGLLDVCFPFSFVKPFLSSLEKSQGHSLGDLNDPKICRALQSRFEHLKVPVRAVLGEQQLPLKDISDLGCGDVIRLGPTDFPLRIDVGNIPLLLGRPGSANKRCAVQISGVYVAQSQTKGDGYASPT